jgi:hypothetical protein
MGAAAGLPSGSLSRVHHGAGGRLACAVAEQSAHGGY